MKKNQIKKIRVNKVEDDYVMINQHISQDNALELHYFLMTQKGHLIPPRDFMFHIRKKELRMILKNSYKKLTRILYIIIHLHYSVFKEFINTAKEEKNE